MGIILFSHVNPKIDPDWQERYENHQDRIFQGQKIRVKLQTVIDDQVRDCHNNRDDDKHSLCNWVHFFLPFTLAKAMQMANR